MYIQNYSLKDDNETWFGKIREISVKLGFAAKPKDYKKNPEDYKGHVGHVSTVIRLAVTGRSQSPDLWEIQRILGEEEIKKRIENFKNTPILINITTRTYFIGLLKIYAKGVNIIAIKISTIKILVLLIAFLLPVSSFPLALI